MPKDEPAAVGWAKDAISELQQFVAKADDGEFDETHLDQAEEHICAARDDLPKKEGD